MSPIIRPATGPLFRAVSANSRSFVSTVLLSKNWENETVADLRQELKKRGLTSSGNKSNLITRLSEHDERQQHNALASPPMQIRKASFTSEPTEVPGVPNIPSPPSNARLNYPIVVLPDLTPKLEIESAPIPFVPDFWDSSKVKAKEQQVTTESSDPKVFTVAGAAVHLGGGPSHNLYYPPRSETAFADYSREVLLVKEEGFLSDVFSDLGLPTTVKIPSANFGSHEVPRADSASARGAWTLIGILFGSWFIAGVVAPKSEVD